MTPEQHALRDEALDWLVKTGDPGFDDWDAFTNWLERSPAHADAYHMAAGDMADMDEWLAEVAAPAVPKPLAAPRRSRNPMRWAIAASFAALAATGAFVFSPAFTSDAYSTAAGQTRTIALGNGDQLILNGDTQVRVSGLDRRDVEIERGQMLLQLASDGHVEVTAGDLKFVDIGTIFEVAREGRSTRLLVEEGSVLADPGGAKVTIKAGQMLETADGARVLRASAAPDAAAGGWTSGQLTYFDATLGQVATDLRRSTGLAFSASAAMAQRRFSGTLSVDQIRNNPSSLGPLVGGHISRVGDQWKLEEGG